MGEFDDPLILASPHLRGQRVKDAQWLLSGHNHFEKTKNPIKPYTGRIDGEYGTQTALATKKAKFWLGYPLEEADRKFGQQIYHLLLGETKLPTEFAKRRTARIKEAAAATVPMKALDLARHEIGTEESPYGSNRQKYGVWYGFNGVPWCAIFVSWCLSHAGWDWKHAYVPDVVGLASRGMEHCYLTAFPQQGDLVTYITPEGRDMHIAFFDEWITPGYEFWDIGGNTGPSNISNGGAVMRQRRQRALVSHFIHLR